MLGDVNHSVERGTKSRWVQEIEGGIKIIKTFAGVGSMGKVDILCTVLCRQHPRPPQSS